MNGLATLYDYTKNVPCKTSLVEDLLRHEEVKKPLGVSNVSIVFECSDLVGYVLNEDVMKSVKDMEFLVRKSKVLLYQGQFDLRGGVVSTNAGLGEDHEMGGDREVCWRIRKIGDWVERLLVMEMGKLEPCCGFRSWSSFAC
jgi:vitellogenic carboxypeptidase-like protein